MGLGKERDKKPRSAQRVSGAQRGGAGAESGHRVTGREHPAEVRKHKQLIHNPF